MQPIAFDSLTYVHMLEQAGVPRVQAEAQAHAQVFLIQQLMEQTLATKKDIVEIKKEIADGRAESKKEIEGLRKELKEDLKLLELKIEMVKSDIFRWVVPMLIGQTALFAAIVKFVR